MDKHYSHWWSGWPGAFCLKCGVDDLMELAIGLCIYDPYTDTWESEAAKAQYMNSPCSESNASYTARTGHIIPPDEGGVSRG